MGNKHGCHFVPCVKRTRRRKETPETAINPGMIPTPPIHNGDNISLQHIQERDPEDKDTTIHPELETLFISKSELEEARRTRGSNHHVERRDHPAPRRHCSCSTILVDDSSISQPNLKTTIKCVSLAVYYHIKNRMTSREMEIFDEKEHPLSKSPVPADYNQHNPDHRHIYKFIRMLFNAAQLTSECAIVTLVYLERLLINAEIDILPGNWKRIVLGAILLSSKVWDDQAVWNVDYCQILRDLTVEDMNEMKRQFLQVLDLNVHILSSIKRQVLLNEMEGPGLHFNIIVLWSIHAKCYFDLRALVYFTVFNVRNEMERQFLQVLDFNINVPSSIYAKYYFDLRVLADAYELSFPPEPLSKQRAKKLEAFSRETEASFSAITKKSLRRVQSDTVLTRIPRFDAAIIP